MIDDGFTLDPDGYTSLACYTTDVALRLILSNLPEASVPRTCMRDSSRVTLWHSA